jgi:3-oxoacyl-(acyl-carrier-protein) synthase
VNNDESESKAMSRLFGGCVPPVSSTKSFTGHTTSASGGIETVICLLAMEYGFIPANLGWKEPSEGCIMPEAEGRSKVSLQHVLCNSFAFGGNDSSLLISNARDHE